MGYINIGQADSGSSSGPGGGGSGSGATRAPALTTHQATAASTTVYRAPVITPEVKGAKTEAPPSTVEKEASSSAEPTITTASVEVSPTSGVLDHAAVAAALQPAAAKPGLPSWALPVGLVVGGLILVKVLSK